MSTNEDWVMSMKIEIVTNAPNAKTIFETSAASGGDMAKLVTTAVANQFRLDGRSGGSGYGTIATFTMTSAVEHTLTLHFKTANSRLDFYVDDTLIASDFEGRANGGGPYYDINFYQVDDSGSNIGVYTYDDVLIGPPLAPPDGTVLSGLHFRGWGASSSDSLVQAAKKQEGSNAALISGVVSNRVNGGAANKVWTDFQVCFAHGDEPASPDTAGSSALFYMATNGYLQVYSGGGFVEQSTDAGGGAVAAVDTNTWTRVTVFTQYDTDEAAIFLDDQLLIEQVLFPSGGATAYSLFAIESADSDAYLDDIEITTLTPSGLSGDVDGDTRPDVNEIQQYGTIGAVGFPGAVIHFL
jgi:hypothetical protein